MKDQLPQVGPIATIYYAVSQRDPRRFSSPDPYSFEFAKALKRDGYRILRVSFRLPDGWDSASATTWNESHEDVTAELTDEK